MHPGSCEDVFCSRRDCSTCLLPLITAQKQQEKLKKKKKALLEENQFNVKFTIVRWGQPWTRPVLLNLYGHAAILFARAWFTLWIYNVITNIFLSNVFLTVKTTTYLLFVSDDLAFYLHLSYLFLLIILLCLVTLCFLPCYSTVGFRNYFMNWTLQR